MSAYFFEADQVVRFQGRDAKDRADRVMMIFGADAERLADGVVKLLRGAELRPIGAPLEEVTTIHNIEEIAFDPHGQRVVLTPRKSIGPVPFIKKA